ncbi:MAG TPA: phenylalanine--tRNA ligase subunit beta, partial [Jatrophihabitans sp.]|nr:phenylalanine--tRNA ligase subunit beta [Jatrophihabitans sp.]
FERYVDPEIAGVALSRCVEMLVNHGGASPADGYTVVGKPREPVVIEMAVDHPSAVAGMPIPPADVIAHLEVVGCSVTRMDGGMLRVAPPSWRPDLLIPADLVEEVVRLAGYEALPSALPAAPPGHGLTPRQRLVRSVSRAIAAAGYTEVLSYPFVSPRTHDALGLAPTDPRRHALRLVNPISEDEPELRTSLLPGLFAAALRNIGRGNRDLAIFEMGTVFLPRPGSVTPAPVPGVAGRPTDAELAALDAALPLQPQHVSVVLCGEFMPSGWWGSGRTGDWADAVEAARVVARTARVDLRTRAADTPPWHPGRCAALLLGDQVVGHAGELHPRVTAALGLPERTCAMELDLDAFPVPEPAVAPEISSYPPVLLDVAVVVPKNVPAADVERTLREAAGPLLESLRLFDVYVDPVRLGPDVRSLAFALRFRAPDRTLTVDEATAARDSAVAAVVERYGARLRS